MFCYLNISVTKHTGISFYIEFLLQKVITGKSSYIHLKLISSDFCGSGKEKYLVLILVRDVIFKQMFSSQFRGEGN